MAWVMARVMARVMAAVMGMGRLIRLWLPCLRRPRCIFSVRTCRRRTIRRPGANYPPTIGTIVAHLKGITLPSEIVPMAGSR